MTRTGLALSFAAIYLLAGTLSYADYASEPNLRTATDLQHFVMPGNWLLEKAGMAPVSCVALALSSCLVFSICLALLHALKMLSQGRKASISSNLN